MRVHAGRWQRRWMAGWLAFTCALSLAAQTRGLSQGEAPLEPNDHASALVHYQFGDNPRYGDPAYDDANWSVSPDGRWNLPDFNSDGIVWVRMQITLPQAATGALALRVEEFGARPVAVQVFVNGRLVGDQGGFPPADHPIYMPPSAVYDLLPGTAVSGAQDLVAVRMWYLPRARQRNGRQSGTSA